MTDDGNTKAFPEHMHRFLARLYAPGSRRYACRASTPEEFAEWQAAARPVLYSLTGLDRIREQVSDHVPAVVEGSPEDCGDFVRQDCTIETEPEVNIPFWLLRPKRGGTFPLAVTPHGHDRIGRDTSAGVPHDQEHARKIAAEDRDVAVQAVRNGFVAIAPATRGLAQGFITDAFGRFGGKDCTSHFMHVLLAGRTSIGERIWDMQRLIDWASNRSDVDARDILMMGNSGGGVLTPFAVRSGPA